MLVLFTGSRKRKEKKPFKLKTRDSEWKTNDENKNKSKSSSFKIDSKVNRIKKSQILGKMKLIRLLRQLGRRTECLEQGYFETRDSKVLVLAYAATGLTTTKGKEKWTSANMVVCTIKTLSLR
jgi:hypothetical protein